MPVPEAFFLPAPDGETGHRFCIFHPPQGEYLRGCVLYIHPFAEEMNKSRRMAALQARALCDAGYAVLQIDLHGCGDSSGDFGDASWAGWIEDIVQAARWLRQRAPTPLWLWGLRAGCLLAAQAARRLDEPCHFLFWAPAPAGRVLLQQFLRLKAAGELLGGDAAAAAEALRLQRAQGIPVEVAGYTLAPALSAGLEQAELSPPFAGRPALAPDPAGPHASRAEASRVVWFEVSPREEAPLSFAASSALAAWQQAGHPVQGRRVRGAAFWQSVEIEDAPALLEATLAALAPPEAAPARVANETGNPPRAGALRPADPCLPRAAQAFGEEPLVFGCGPESLLGILHRPAGAGSDTAVLVVVGGPQYRAGSHRQFVLLARRLAAAGHPVLRFDYRGMGDSSGALRDFEQAGDDIRAAIDRLQQRLPSVRHVVLWGLCDGASAALLYRDATADVRVRGVCALNPWVRSPRTEARTRLKHYYAGRVLQAGFWRKLLSGKVAFGALGELRQNLRAANSTDDPAPGTDEIPFQQRMARGWQALDGRTLLILSGRDHTAKEFGEYVAGDGTWREALRHPRATRHELPEADHTFSDASMRAAVERLTLEWLEQFARETPLNRTREHAEFSDGSQTA